MKHWGLASKIAATVTVVVLLGLALGGALAWQATDRRFLGHELRNARDETAESVAAARAMFDARYPGPWHVVAASAGERATYIITAPGFRSGTGCRRCSPRRCTRVPRG